MEYKGSTPMPNITLVDNPGWHSVPVSCLHSNIQKVLKDIWKHDSMNIMFKSELSRVTLCLHTRGYKCALLYFE